MGTFEIWEKPVVFTYIVEFLTAFPNSKLLQIANELSFCFDRNVTRKVVWALLREMKWSWKVPTSFQIWKYTQENIEKYLMYIEWVQGVSDKSKLKYLDESHFVPRQLTNGK
jgi:hypothetical protein